MQSRLLHNFLTVADCGSITEASSVLHVSQSALTKSIQKLEATIGVDLFDRSPTGISLTPYGSILLRHVKVMDNEYRHALSGIEGLKTGSIGALQIGAGPVWVVAILPAVITQFQKQYPGISVSLESAVTGSLVPGLLNGDYDVIFSALGFPERSELEKHELINIHNVLIVGASHPLAGLKNITTSDLQTYPWALLKGDPVARERLNAYFAAYGFSPPNVGLETTSIYSLLQSLHDGNGVANVPEQMLPLASSIGLVRLDVQDLFWETTAGYVLRRTARPSSALEKFIEVTKAHLSSMGSSS